MEQYSSTLPNLSYFMFRFSNHVSSPLYTGDDLVGNKVIFPNGSGGIVVAQRFPVIFALSDTEQIENTDGAVTILDSKAIISVGPRIMDCFGRPILEDGSPDTQTTSEHESSTLKRPMLAAIPQVKDIALINTPLLTGTTMVDALAPLGKGQNMLVIGHDLGTMRGFSTDFLKTQLALGKTKCVYGITNGKDRSAIIAEFRQAGILDDVTIVSASSQDKDEVTLAAEAIAVGATACAIGEAHALSEGLDALVIVDTLDEHKVLWDATTRVLVDVYGAEAVVQDDRKGAASSEMRAFYSGLIQRAAKYKKNRGGGSLSLSMICSIPSMQGETKDGEEEPIFSAKDFEGCNDKIKARLDILINKKIPLTASILRKINLPIPSVSESKRRFILQHIDDLISMSDGQIWLDETLSDAGQRPPLDPQRSITRVGIGADTISRADAPAVRQIVGGLRLDLSQALCMDGAEANAASEKQVRMRNAWLLAMHQEAGRGGRTLGETCVTLLAAKVGAFDDCIDKGGFAGTKAGNSVVMNLLEHVKNTAPALLKDIDETLDMSDESMNELEGVIKSFF